MTRHLFGSLALSVAIFSGGCGGDDRPDPSTAPAALDLAGRWLSECVDQGNGTFARLDFDLTESDWALEYVVHGDAACSAALATVHIAGGYAVERPSAAVAGAHEARFGFGDKTITAHVDAIAEQLTSAGCGADAWQLGVAQSVADGCAAFGQHPIADCPADYDVVKRDGDQLNFGKRPADNDMCTAAKRPTELSPVTLARRP
jgi:hypothetical protein